MPDRSKSSTIIDPAAPPQWVKPHPGEMLREEYMEPLGLSANALARGLGVPPNRVTAILRGERSITADTAWRLARYWGTSAQYWMNLQQAYDLSKAWAEDGAKIERDVRVRHIEKAA